MVSNTSEFRYKCFDSVRCVPTVYQNSLSIMSGGFNCSVDQIIMINGLCRLLTSLYAWANWVVKFRTINHWVHLKWLKVLWTLSWWIWCLFPPRIVVNENELSKKNQANAQLARSKLLSIVISQAKNWRSIQRFIFC